jgi:hypothetical protein
LVGKSEGNTSFGIPRRGLEDNIKMGVREIGWEGVNLIHEAPDRYQWQAVMNMVTKRPVAKKSEKFLD